MADYGNWVRKRIVINIMVIGIAGLLVSALPINPIPRVIAFLIAVVTLLTAGYLLYMYYQLSENGGGYQRKLWDFVLSHLQWDGQGTAIDIGTGNAPLAVALAKQYPQAHVTGIDYWGTNWEFAQSMCERNAAIEGVAEQLTFQKCSAADLPFADGEFDAAISHFVFHEVKDTGDKRDVIREALRVLRKGGVFAFQDMFYDGAYYGDVDALISTIRSWGIQEVHLVDTRRVLDIPLVMRHPRVMGRAALIYGTK